ncbi:MULTISPECIES: acyltransferase [Flavobacterium]|uniref:Acyltransferase n=1 Tax=Flavobacterium jumunjinense TaxID=998845 RepID=A0ABV5GJ68_9FLAO|nr:MULTISPECIES: acyltransferase [Flavobacterium]
MYITNKIIKRIFIKLKIYKYKMLSSCINVKGNPLTHQAILYNGEGKIFFGNNVNIGFEKSKNFYSHYAYFEARGSNSEISIGSNVYINNAFSVESVSKIIIEDDVLIGVNCSIFDSDGHHLDVDKRHVGIPNSKPIKICKNVFIGDDVTILKGVTIGENSIIGCKSLVSKSIPKNCVYAGNPVKFIREIN